MLSLQVATVFKSHMQHKVYIVQQQIKINARTLAHKLK